MNNEGDPFRAALFVCLIAVGLVSISSRRMMPHENRHPDLAGCDPWPADMVPAKNIVKNPDIFRNGVLPTCRAIRDHGPGM